MNTRITRPYALFAILIATAIVLSACGSTSTTPAPIIATQQPTKPTATASNGPIFGTALDVAGQMKNPVFLKDSRMIYVVEADTLPADPWSADFTVGGWEYRLSPYTPFGRNRWEYNSDIYIDAFLTAIIYPYGNADSIPANQLGPYKWYPTYLGKDVEIWYAKQCEWHIGNYLMTCQNAQLDGLEYYFGTHYRLLNFKTIIYKTTEIDTDASDLPPQQP